MDICLSSGFLAFARHAGFLAAVEDAGLTIEGICGTSSGALVGALWAAGYPATEVLHLLSEKPPVHYLGWHLGMWRGAFSMHRTIRYLRHHLPATFEELPKPFGVGVRLPDGTHSVLHQRSLPEAVAASCAIPRLFAPVRLEGVPYADGGMVQRVPAREWLRIRGDRPLLVHLVAPTYATPMDLDVIPLAIVETPASGAKLWNLGDVWGQFEEARAIAQRVLSYEF